MVMPDSASSFIVSSTSLIISGSSAEVGSSNSITFGFIASERAIATRCCWPPESWPGNLWACSGILTRVEQLHPLSSASALGILRTWRGASVMLSSTVRWGNRLKLWKTIPVSRRISWMLRMSSESSTPSTTIWPRSCSSSRLMQRISVDLPEPDGPHTTTTSCLPTFMLMSFSAWKSSKNLSTPTTSIITSPEAPIVWVASAKTSAGSPDSEGSGAGGCAMMSSSVMTSGSFR